MFVEIDRQYQIRPGMLRIHLMLFIPEGNLPRITMDVIKDIELNYGYEDQDDLLTFYPNTVKLTFDDIDKCNYFALKNSLSNYNNTLPQNKSIYGGVEIYLNETRKFSGFIDPLTLDWKEYDRTVVFEAICYTSQLKDITVDRNNYIIRNVNGADEIVGMNYYASMLAILYGVYKQVWSDFEPWLYPTSVIDYSIKGIFCKHDWNLIGRGIYPAVTAYANWADVQDIAYTLMHYDSTRFFGTNRICNSYADMIRILALQFGAIIGVEDVNKVYFIKRFGLNRNDCIDISDNRIKLEKSLHLNPLRGVQVTNDWQGIRTFDYGDIERTSSGELKYPEKVHQLNTYIGSYQDPGYSGTCIEIYDPVSGRYLPVFGNTWDPEFGNEGSACHMYELVGKWTHENRRTSKEKVEVELIGTNYSMAKTYVISPDSEGLNKVYFRPMQMSKNLMKDKTKITGLEI